MELTTRKKWRMVCDMCMILIVGGVVAAFSGCGGDSGGDGPVTPVNPSLTLNPSDLQFSDEKGDKHDLTIKTDVDATWKIVYVPSWLSASSLGGTGTTTITLTTLSKNDDEERRDQVQVEVTNSAGGKTSQTIAVTQKGVPENCYAQVMDGSCLVMSYGFASVLECGSNTSYMYWRIYTESEYNNIKGDNQQIIAESKKWTRVNIPSELATEIIYNGCMPNRSYYLITVSYTQNGSSGKVYVYPFTSKAAEAPLAEVTPEAAVVNEVHGGDSGPWYKWEVKKSGTCAAYYTYVCASDKLTTTMKNRKGVYGQYVANDGVNVAWEIWKEHKSNQLTHKTNFNEDNANGREQLFEIYSEGATQWLTAKNSDKFLQIVTWGVDRNNNYSGLVYDVVYQVENGKIVGGQESAYLNVSPATLSFGRDGGTQELSITGNDSWQIASDKSWCTLSMQSGTGNAAVSVFTTANNEGSSRQATITVTGEKTGTHTVTVTQEAGATSSVVVGRDDYDGDKDLEGGTQLSVSTTSITMEATGDSKTVNVSSNDVWTVTSNQSWCVVSPASGQNNGTVTIKAASNDSSSARSTTVTVKGRDSGKSATINVSQPASKNVGRNDYEGDKELK